jgi:succinate dehydrogenase / fumarate reductase, iron-sulfur subunit
MKIALRIWRQRDPYDIGRFVHYDLDQMRPETTLLEALDVLNEGLVARGELPVAFDSDCREGICGACGLVVDGRPHGPVPGATTCLVTLRAFGDGGTITLEPFRTGAFPIVRDLVVDRRALDRIVQAGGYVSVRTGSAPEANTIPVERDAADRALDAAACIGCGACVAAAPTVPQRCSSGRSSRISVCCPRGNPSARAASVPSSLRRTARDSAAARSTVNARPRAPSASTSASSPG